MFLQKQWRSNGQFLFMTLIYILSVDAKITENGIWSDYDLNTTYYDIINGKISYTTEMSRQRIVSAQITWIRHLGNIYEQPNVLLVNSILSEQDFNDFFPDRNWSFTQNERHKYLEYGHFLTAVAQYPAFCGEYVTDVADNLESATKACGRELATLLAHMTYETSDTIYGQGGFYQSMEQTGLKNMMEDLSVCTATIYNDWCKYRSYGTFYQPEDDIQYWGRGPIHLRWNHKLGQFSKAYHDDELYGKYVHLSQPWTFTEDPVEAFASALWLYMTPHYPIPSAHNVITGFFEANDKDLKRNLGNNFGTTILIMAQDPSSSQYSSFECHTYSQNETLQAQARAHLFTYFGNFFGLDEESDESNSCATKLIDFEGSGAVPSFWDLSQDFRCKLVTHETQWSVYNDEDYKRCVCHFWSSNEELDCSQILLSQTCGWVVGSGDEQSSVVTFRVPVLEDGSEIKLVPHSLLNSLVTSGSFPACRYNVQLNTSSTDQFQEPDFYALELIRDNENRSVTSQSFREDFLNQNDSTLGSDAPKSMYIATLLGQESLIYNAENPGLILTAFDAQMHTGTWQFQVKACVDRRSEDYESLDCDPGQNLVNLEIIECANLEDADQYTECQETVKPEDSDDNKDQEEEEEADLVDENYPPYFTRVDEFSPKFHELARGSETIIQLSDFRDDNEGDVVSISVPLTEAQSDWISFDSLYRSFTVKPNKNTPLNYNGVLVILDDTKIQTIESLGFWILEDPDKKPVVDPEQPSDPQTPPEPTVDPTIPTDPVEDPPTDEVDDKPENPTPKPDEPDWPKQEVVENNFDPNTLWALKALKDRVKKQRDQVLVTIAPEKIKELKKPKSSIEYINEIGEVKLIFSQEMYLQDIFADFKFVTAAVIKDDFQEERLRSLQQIGSKVNLSSVLKSEISRGDEETSAPISKLGFQVILTDFNEQTLNLKIKFENPLSLSIGDKPDILTIKFVEPELFTSKETGKTLPPKSVITYAIPKQFPSEASYEIAVLAGSTVQVAANTAFLSQFGVTICLAVSLKAMWNLMHVMQVMAYLRLLVEMPANSNIIMLSMHNAISLENIINSFYDSLMPSFIEDDAEDSAEAEELKDSDIPYKNIYLSLGIFGVVISFLLVALILYFLLRCLSLRIRICAVIMSILKRKLFYNVWVRYMIESNLKVTNNCIFYLYISGSFDKVEDKVQTSVRVLILLIIVIWPFFMTLFLHFKRGQLDKPRFKTKFISMYNGIKQKKFSSLMYTSVFCFRRLMLVCALLIFKDKGIWVILAFNAIQTLYFWYMTLVVPHEEAIHNRLEYFNELCVILIQYMMFMFISGSGLDPELQWDFGIAVISIVGVVFGVNVIALIFLTIQRVIFWCRVKKARQAYLKIRVRRGAVRLSSSRSLLLLALAGEDPLNDALSVSGVGVNEAIEVEGLVKIPTTAVMQSQLGTNVELCPDFSESKLIQNKNIVQEPESKQQISMTQTIFQKASSYIGQLFIEPEQDSKDDTQEIVDEPVPISDALSFERKMNANRNLRKMSSASKLAPFNPTEMSSEPSIASRPPVYLSQEISSQDTLMSPGKDTAPMGAIILTNYFQPKSLLQGRCNSGKLIEAQAEEFKIKQIVQFPVLPTFQPGKNSGFKFKEKQAASSTDPKKKEQPQQKNSLMTFLAAGKGALKGLITKKQRTNDKVPSAPLNDLESGQSKGPQVSNLVKTPSSTNEDALATDIVMARDSLTHTSLKPKTFKPQKEEGLLFPINLRPRPAHHIGPSSRKANEIAQARYNLDLNQDNQRGGQNPRDPTADNSERP